MAQIELSKITEHLNMLDRISEKMLNDFSHRNKVISSSLLQVDTDQHLKMTGGGRSRQAMPQTYADIPTNTRRTHAKESSLSISTISTITSEEDSDTTTSGFSSSKSASKTPTSKGFASKTPTSEKTVSKKTPQSDSSSSVVSSSSHHNRRGGKGFTSDMIESSGYDLACNKAGKK